MLANLVILLHLGYFAFVVGGFAATVWGVGKREPWVRNPWFRIAHFASVWIVLVEDWFAWDCPLNVAEASLREAEAMTAGVGTEENFLTFLLHHTISEQTLDVLYWTMGAVLVILMLIARPRFGENS